ncbi:MAG: hypothetical protein K2J70_08240 [Muribaculaceae bacterium]|nr:hypothetical protein [Muribaculaceae bacterium]
MARLDIESIKDAVYELEGLLELADLREDKVSALLPLMKNKLKIINTLFSEDSVIPEEEEMEVEEETTPPSVDELPASAGEEGESEQTEYPAPESRGDSEPCKPDLPEKLEEAATPETLEVISVPEVEEFVLPDEDEEISVGGEIPVAPRPSGSVGNVAGKPAFCINDRFRFRRELFKNSDKEFENAMNVVTTMDSYDEAEEYFIGDLGWDYENPEVSDFMAIIRGYFEK